MEKGIEAYTIVMFDMTTGLELTGSRRTISAATPNNYGCQYYAYADTTQSSFPNRVQFERDRLYRIDMFPASPTSIATPGSFYYYLPTFCTAGSNVFCPGGQIGGQGDAVFFIGNDGPKTYLAAFGAFGVGQSVEDVFATVPLGESWVLPYDVTRYCALAPSSCPGPAYQNGVPAGSNIMFLSRIPFASGPASLPVPLHAALQADWRVPSSVTYNWSSADVSQIMYGTGGHITVNGTLNSTGLALTAENVSQGWGGIQYNAGSGGTITGGEITKVKTYGGAAVSITNASPTFQNVRISDSPCCGTDGFYVIGSGSNPTIQGTTIRDMSGTGVTIGSYAHGRLVHNVIRDNGEDGVLAGYGATPFLSPDAPNNDRIGNDILFNSGNGVYASGSSTYITYGWYYYAGSGYAHADGYNEIRGNTLAGNRVVLGSAIAGGGSTANRRNGFFLNGGNEAEAVGSGSRAYVSCDYWGPNSAPPFQTSATSGGTVTLSTYLTQNPRANPFEACQNINVVGELGKSGETPGGGSAAARGDGDLGQFLEEAAGLAMIRPAEAFDLLRQVVAEGDDDLASAAIAEAGRIASGRQALPAARAFLAEQAASAPPRRQMAALRALVGVRHDAGDADGALDAARTLAESPEADDAAFGALASVYLFAEAGRDAEALDALGTLERLLPESREAALARRSLGLPVAEGRVASGEETAAKTGENVAAATELLAVRPNPTGGAAVVPFRLAESAHVQVSVYDVLGRSVAVLVDGAFEAGEHAATLDASRLAPGVYVVRLDVRSRTGESVRQTSRGRR